MGTEPVTDYDSRVGCKSHGIGDKSHKKTHENAGSVTFS